MLTTSVVRQGGSQGVQPQPAFHRASDTTIRANHHPSRCLPPCQEWQVRRAHPQACVGPQTQVKPPCFVILFSEIFVPRNGVVGPERDLCPLRIAAQVPAPNLSIEPVCRGAEPDVWHTRPVSRVVSCPSVWSRVVRHLVVLQSRFGQEPVRREIIALIT